MNKSLSASLALSLFLTASIFTPAMGSEKNFSPLGAWALTKVDRVSTNGKSYCTLSQRYDDNMILSLGRNTAEEYSLAVDFQKDVFEKDKSLKISLQPGPGQLRAYDLMPSSEKALVVRLGWDEGFFKTLNETKLLKLGVGEKSYSFKLSDIEKGQKDLENCMDDLKEAAASANINTASGEEKSKDVLTAQAGKSEQGFDAQRLSGKASSLVPQSIVKSDDDKPKDIEVNKKNFASKSNENQPVKEKMVDIKSSEKNAVIVNTEPKMAVNAIQDSKPTSVVANNGSQDKISGAAIKKPDNSNLTENKDLMAKVSSLEKSLKIAQSNSSKASDSKIKDAELEQDKESAKLISLEAKLKETEIRNAQLEDTLRQSQTRIAETAINTETKSFKQISELESKLAAMQSDNLKMAQLLESFKLQKEDKTLNLVAGDWNLEKATKRFNESEREIQRIALQLEKERSSCNMEKKQIESMLFDPAVTEKAQIQKLSNLEREIERLKTAAPSQDAIKEIAALKSSLELQKKNEDVLMGENKSLKDKAQILEASLKAEQGKGASIDSQSAAMNAQIEELKRQVAMQASLKSENESLKAKAQSLEASLKVEQGKGASIDSQSAAMNAQMDDLKKQVEMQVSLKSENESLKAKAQSLEASLKVEQGKGASIDSQSAAMNAQIEELKKQVAMQVSVISENEILKKQVVEKNALSAQLTGMAQQNNELKALTLKLQNDLLLAQASGGRADQLAALQIQMDNLKKQIALKDNQNATYQNQLAVLKRENIALVENGAQMAGVNPAAGGMASITPAPALKQAIINNVQPDAQKISLSSNMAQTIKSTLERAGAGFSGFSTVSKGLSGADNFAWVGGNGLKGFASIKVSKGDDFDSNIDQYLAYQKSMCEGDFASMPSPSFGSAAIKMSLYEVACVGGAQSTSASLLLYENDDKFIAISNHTNAANMDIAMDGRDKIAQALRGL